MESSPNPHFYPLGKKETSRFSVGVVVGKVSVTSSKRSLDRAFKTSFTIAKFAEEVEGVGEIDGLVDLVLTAQHGNLISVPSTHLKR